MTPVEPASDGELGYNTARSEVDSDGCSRVSETPPRYTQPEHGTLHEDDVEVEELSDDDGGQLPEDIEIGTLGGSIKKKTSQDPPADVKPIGHIPRIASVEGLGSNSHPTPPPEDDHAKQRKVPVYEAKKDHLVGMTIDEWGDILDDNAEVLGRVEGDLPSMIGRKISNARGDVLGDDGGLLGYVAEVGPGKGHPQSSKPTVPTWSLEEVEKAMAAAGKGPGGLRVDPFGNILDAEGNSVGSFHDNVSGFGRKSGAFPEDTPNGDAEESMPQSTPSSRPKQPKAKPAPRSKKPEGTATERRDKAQSQKKEENPLNPSDIFLDVKSTTEGIQLTIRIPTVFNSGGSPARPKITIE
ncbi:hypothetical protein N0V93_007271 [Gnomoniopsis smithogilvyi]|uniref:Uncharacterized protein n=1 Tax=Gnomoniopsis smithogilvyi TaxID=1191159 RepID=A0A9W8YRH5_9PEZI|nr:hypothetical protein N0V93_007271 [Gnomoniopsis smithogilvyi]